MASFRDYETRTAINAGVKMPLIDPFTGEDRGDWLRLRYSMADDYIAARERASQAKLLGNGADTGTVEENAALFTPLIAEWSFDEPCTPENVFAFLCEAPHLHAPILNEVALSGKLLTKPSASSLNGRDENSSCTGDQTETRAGER